MEGRLGYCAYEALFKSLTMQILIIGFDVGVNSAGAQLYTSALACPPAAISATFLLFEKLNDALLNE
ncbi:unnamed protein product [Dovyalis caffra]|uniref:Uncharacterized protein n=1 Tax=Dovyalis caffra TaxID=77055 RepID=A0AAV1S890_9ROSI|nr:unnamed protein product [Dovyalis caffra]